MDDILIQDNFLGHKVVPLIKWPGCNTLRLDYVFKFWGQIVNKNWTELIQLTTDSNRKF